MSMRDIGADDFPQSTFAEFLFHVFGQLLDGGHEGGVIFVREFVNFVDFVFRDYESVALRFWVNIEEGEGFVILVDFVTRDFTVDYFCEDAWHFSYSF